MSKRQYSDEDRGTALAVLDACGGNVAKAARDTDVPRKTLEEWRDGRGSPEVANIRHLKKAALADCLEDILRQAINAVPDKFKTASLHEINGTVKISAETMQLLRGDPTSINETRQTELSDDERAARIADLLDRSRNRRGVAVSDTGGAGGSYPAVDVGAVH